jgi:hypothetical protein
VTLELAREEPPASRTCRICGKAVAKICTDCGIEVETGDLVAPPAPPPPPERDGSRPVRREAARVAAQAPTSTREILSRGLAVSADGLPGTLACLAIVAFALSFQVVPMVNAPLPWPGMLGSTFVLAFLVIERARAAHEGPGGRLETSGAFDPASLGTSMLCSLLLFPIFAGTFASGPLVGFGLGIPIALVFPGLLGALVCDGWAELAPDRLKDVFLRSPNYVGTTFYSMISLVISLSAVWLVPGSAFWRAPIAVAFATLAGTLCGLMRRDAETVLED